MKSQTHPGWANGETEAREGAPKPPEEVPLRPGEWLAPRDVRVDESGTQLRYQTPDDWRVVSAHAGLLAEFVKLGSAKPETIRRFASRNGVLELCRHGVPFRHSDPDNDPAIDLDFDPSDLASIQQLLNGNSRHVCTRQVVADPDGRDWCWESLDHWRELARAADALVQAAELVRAGHQPDPEQLRIARVVGRDEPVPDRFGVRDWIAGSINYWLALGGHARLSVAIDGNGNPRPVVDCAGLFTALGQQLMSRVVNPTGKALAIGEPIALCCDCGRPYVPKMRPRTDRNNFCPDCGERSSWKFSQRKRSQARL